MKKILYIAVIVSLGINLYGQQIPHLSQYSQNYYSLNPAAAGSTDDIPVAISYRKLWAGFAESPSVQYASAHGKILPDMGAGAKIFNFQTGPSRKSGLELSYSYQIQFKSEFKWSFGLSFLLYQFKLDKSKLTYEEQDDNVFLNGKEQMIVPDANFGTMFYNDKLCIGLSIPQLFNRNIDLKTDKIIQEKQVRHYYLYADYKIDANEDLSLDPSLLLKFIEAGLYQADINLQSEYKDLISLGIGYRTSDAVIIQAGYRYSKFYLGYSYDIILSGLNVSTFGSHEILMVISLDNFIQKKKIKLPI